MVEYIDIEKLLQKSSRMTEYGKMSTYKPRSMNRNTTYKCSVCGKLCCKINEIIDNVTETTQSEPKIEEKPKKKVYAIFFEKFFFGDHYNRYVQFVETEDIFHEVGVLIYKASTAVSNIQWVELRDVSVEAAIARYMSKYSEDWKRTHDTNILRFIGDNDI